MLAGGAAVVLLLTGSGPMPPTLVPVWSAKRPLAEPCGTVGVWTEEDEVAVTGVHLFARNVVTLGA